MSTYAADQAGEKSVAISTRKVIYTVLLYVYIFETHTHTHLKAINFHDSSPMMSFNYPDNNI